MSDIRDRCRGMWQSLLPQLGVPVGFLNGRNQPCPICGGKDRARFTNKGGDGVFICNQCGAGNGITLAMKLNGWDYKTACLKIDERLPEARRDKPADEKTDLMKRDAMNRLWFSSIPITASHAVGKYLAMRCGVEEFPPALRCVDALPFRGRDMVFPAMLAKVTGPDGAPVNIHRTWVAPRGTGKAPVDDPRRMMAGTVPPGSAIRLAPEAEVMGVAEGIETALSASAMSGVPVWSTIGTFWLETWRPPECVKRLFIFADHDRNYAGHVAAYRLANIISVNKAWAHIDVQVRMPQRPGSDWNDVHQELIAEERNAGVTGSADRGGEEAGERLAPGPSCAGEVQAHQAI